MSKEKILEAATQLFREKGYTSTRVEDLCAAAKLTKGGFFHHFASKEAMAVAAVDRWTAVTGEFFAGAPYQQIADPLERVLAYVDFRKSMLDGPLPEITCLAGTLVQEIYDSSPAIRAACERSIRQHVATVAQDLAEAKRLYAPSALWAPESVALHTHVVIQGGFVLAKTTGSTDVAAQSLDHLRHYLTSLFVQPSQQEVHHAVPEGRNRRARKRQSPR